MNDTNSDQKEKVLSPQGISKDGVSESTEPSFRSGGLSRGKRGRRPGRSQRERVRPEFDQKTLGIRRVARVVAGGRRFSLSAAVVAGNRKGMVGVGLGKGLDTALALDKAFRDAKKNMISIPLTKEGGIPHDVLAKYASAKVLIMASRGRGLVAGGAARAVLELSGITSASAKILSPSKNALNNARATIKALRLLRRPK